MPVPVPKAKLNVSLDTELGLRPVVLRHLRERSVFKLQECLGRAFREYLQGQGFTEIHTPKIVHAGAEGGSNIFRLDYFGRKAFLAQSPQFYKQTMVGVVRAGVRGGPRVPGGEALHCPPPQRVHLHGLGDGLHPLLPDVMEVETGFLRYAMDLLEREYAEDLRPAGGELPDVEPDPLRPL